jgi:uncharacterized C2H2 Zn-finger protein
MKRNWTCPSCRLVFSRKWNLQRHVGLMHGVNENPGIIQSPLKITYDNTSRADNYLTGLKQDLKLLSDISDMQNKIYNSRQTSNNQNSLEWQVNSLRQQLASYEKRYSDLLSYNWLIPRGDIHGISGYICKKCRTFSLKPIINPGYDMTMERKHRCAESPDKRSYIVLPIPSNIPDVDYWAAQTLLNHINFIFPVGKYLIAIDVTEDFNLLGYKSIPVIVRQYLGIPGRFHFHSFENNFKVSWIEQAIDNLDKVIAMTDDEALDFFKKVKSTYAIFEVPVGETVRQFFMTFTNYYESPQYHTDIRTIKRINSDEQLKGFH